MAPHHTSGCPRIIVVFLDVDGVLLPFPASSSNNSKGRLFPDATLDALTLLLQAFAGPPAAHQQYAVSIVLSSTWRVSESMQQEILDDFSAYGKGPLASLKRFYDITDPAMHTERQHEIYDWLQRTNTPRTAANDNDGDSIIAAWVALDDEELIQGAANAQYRKTFEGHAVLCDSKIGLTAELAAEAIQLIRHQLLAAEKK